MRPPCSRHLTGSTQPPARYSENRRQRDFLQKAAAVADAGGQDADADASAPAPHPHHAAPAAPAAASTTTLKKAVGELAHPVAQIRAHARAP